MAAAEAFNVIGPVRSDSQRKYNVKREETVSFELQ